ncbi:MAG: hypothetical protein K9K62_08645 [Desulfobacteraceae bacterium]|nr:hypothetical protein [Desulfobacteraceae bacterium]
MSCGCSGAFQAGHSQQGLACIDPHVHVYRLNVCDELTVSLPDIYVCLDRVASVFRESSS